MRKLNYGFKSELKSIIGIDLKYMGKGDGWGFNE